MTNVIDTRFQRHIANGNLDLGTDTITGTVGTSARTPDQEPHTWRSDVTNEVSRTVEDGDPSGRYPVGRIAFRYKGGPGRV